MIGRFANIGSLLIAGFSKPRFWIFRTQLVFAFYAVFLYFFVQTSFDVDFHELAPQAGPRTGLTFIELGAFLYKKTF
ncbi:MAG: hypothetical protein A2X56_06100 [Nitrospirae bacterium GWC2_57_13]|nr:MAG: hypothetical protein A2X56_06100 [Nitrospirae bacterium GWC2_57_13]